MAAGWFPAKKKKNRHAGGFVSIYVFQFKICLMLNTLQKKKVFMVDAFTYIGKQH
jgi:hypothetical protein